MFKKLRNLYLWVKRLFKKPMSVQETYKVLIALNNDVLNNMEHQLKEGIAKDYISFVNRDGVENTFIEFKIGQYRFLFQSEIQPDQGKIIHKVFQRTLDLTYYPDSKRYVQTHIPELDVISYTHLTHEFRVEQKSKGSFPKAGVLIPFRNIQSYEFGTILTEQVEQWLYQQHKPKTPPNL